MTEIRGDEHEGWTHTLEIQTTGRKVVLDTYWRRPAETPTPVALGPADALRTAAALVQAAYDLVKNDPNPERARELRGAWHDVAAPVAEMRGWLDALTETRNEES